MPFTANMTGTTQLDDSILTAFDAGFMLQYAQSDVMSPLASVAEIVGGSYQIPRYAQLSVSTTALTEDEDVASQAMADTKVTFTPAEYGTVVTKTALASLQTGGKADLAAARLIGMHVGRTMNKLACAALDASSNVRLVNGTAEGSMTTADVLDTDEINRAYNKLARASVPMVGDQYVFVAHEDALFDLRGATATGAWTDVNKYANVAEVLRNEIGSFGGFRFVRNNDATYADQTGAGTVDVYNSYAMGFNALGVAISKQPEIVFTSTDKLGRFVNVGWHGVMQFKIVEQDSIWVIRSTSTVGANS